MKKNLALSSLLVPLLLGTTLCGTEFITKDINREGKSSSWIALPFIFSSDSMGLTGGVVGIANGFIQPQMTIIASAFIGEELPVQTIDPTRQTTEGTARSRGVFLGISGYKPSFSKRMFLTFLGSYAYYPNQKIYLDGENDSIQDIDDPISSTPLQTQGYNNWASLDFRFVLPMGEGKNDITPTIELSRGMPVNRDDKGNGLPFVSGQTLVGFKYFYNMLTADKFTKNPSLNTNGLRFYVEHDNTDYPANPSRGYNIELQTSIDFGWANSNQSWNSVEAGYSHYFELPNFSWTRQSVIALNAWTAYSPSWDKSEQSSHSALDKNQPPMWEGARLGGFERMRAYDMNRFSDKAAIYGAIEYRMIPEFNPMHGQKWNPIPIDWFQAVLFAEVGRVAPEYDFKLFAQDLKYDVGISLRILAAKVPVRFEMAYGEEGSNMWIMIKQPF